MNRCVVFYRVARPFKLGSRSFAKGEIVQESDPVVPRVLNEHPEWLFVTVRNMDLDAPPGIRRESIGAPQEPAALRSCAAVAGLARRSRDISPERT